MEIKKSPKVAKIFNCEKCDYVCSKESDFNKHLMTRKHQKMHIGNEMEIAKMEKKQTEFKCSNCEKIYKTNCGVWKHNKKCKEFNNTVNNTDNEFIKLLIKENADFKDLIHNILIDIVKNNNTTINNTVNNNKTFNLQFFLNETCKDAMNLMDFVNSISLQLSDLENVKNLGYVDGITGIIVKKINEMEVHKRPIHCSDAKREIMYVREDDIWEKEDDNHNRLRKAIKYISKKNRILLNEWSESHPEANDIHSPQNLEYMLMIVQSMGGKGELVDNENKIMKKIMKNVLIDKI